MKWVPYPDTFFQCPRCGAPIEAFTLLSTEEVEEGQVVVGDRVRCMETESCGFIGTLRADDEGPWLQEE